MLKASAIYNTYRPMTFDEVDGQMHVTENLKSKINSGSISHAYLFTGTRGTGKTSTARILSRAVNCLSPKGGNPCNECSVCKSFISDSSRDYHEIDAASNNGVADIVEILKSIEICSTDARFKIYLLDEVHMLSKAAFDKLLTVLEEPREGIVFILATTEPHKIPATIKSRCQTFEFRTIGLEDIIQRLKYVIDDQHKSCEPLAVEAIAKAANGSMRDGLSHLETCMRDHITLSYVEDVLGLVNEQVLLEIGWALVSSDVLEILKAFDLIKSRSVDMKSFVSNLMELLRDVMISKYVEKKNFTLKNRTREVAQEIHNIGSAAKPSQLHSLVDSLCDLSSHIHHDTYPAIRVESKLLTLASQTASVDSSDVYERLALLEKEVENLKSSSALEGLCVSIASPGAYADADGESQGHESVPLDNQPANNACADDESMNYYLENECYTDDVPADEMSTEKDTLADSAPDNYEADFDVDSLIDDLYGDDGDEGSDNNDKVSLSTTNKTANPKPSPSKNVAIDDYSIAVSALFGNLLLKACLYSSLYEVKDEKLTITVPLSGMSRIIEDNKMIVNKTIADHYDELNISKHHIYLVDNN